MDDITYCMSRYCAMQDSCARHYTNNNLTGKVYSASDFTPVSHDEMTHGVSCEYFISKNRPMPKPHKYHYCEKCNNLLEDDIQYGELGVPYIHCEYCGEDNELEDEDYLELTKDNVRFPQHYYNFGRGKSIDNDTINKWVKKCINYLEKNPNEDHIFTASGDTVVHVTRFEGDGTYNVQVCKNYYDTDVKINA